MNITKTFFYIYGWLCVRPRRWFFWKIVCNTYPIWLPKYEECWQSWQLPNIHWWILYRTIFKFFNWLHYDAWRIGCKWENRWLKHQPIISRLIQRIGQTTAGFVIHGGECFHCSSEDGCQVELANDGTGTNFILEKAWSVGTQDGTDHRFCGTTICPKCGYRAYYEDGSL